MQNPLPERVEVSRPPCTIFEPFHYGFKVVRNHMDMKSSILYYPVLVIKNRPVILKILFICGIVFGICALENAYGQSNKDGSYVGLEDMHYVSREKHSMFKWYHLTHVTIKDDSVWVYQNPVAIHKHDTIWSSSDGAFYYYEGMVTIKERQIAMNLSMTNCDYCAIPEDSVRAKKILHRIWSGQMMDDGIMIDSSFYSRSNYEATRWRKPHNE